MYSAFPHVISKYIREMSVLSLDEAIYKMAMLPSKVLGIYDRDALAPDKYADLVILNFKEISDKATYDSPKSFPEGVIEVFVNGAATKSDPCIHKGQIIHPKRK